MFRGKLQQLAAHFGGTAGTGRVDDYKIRSGFAHIHIRCISTGTPNIVKTVQFLVYLRIPDGILADLHPDDLPCREIFRQMEAKESAAAVQVCRRYTFSGSAFLRKLQNCFLIARIITA